MEPSPSALTRAMNDARRERGRAVRAGAIARRHEDLHRGGKGPLADLHPRLAVLHRQMELRHLAAADIHDAYADRLRRSMAEPPGAAPSMIFMAAVAEAARSDNAVLSMVGNNRVEALAAASSTAARAAHDMEFTLGEGPIHDVLATGKTVFVTGCDLIADWPHFGGAAAELGVRTVAAVPLEGPAGLRLGGLAVFEPWLGDPGLVIRVLRTVAEALTHSVLLAWEPAERQAIPPLFEEADYRPVVFQAAGIVTVQCRCDFESALAMLRARAFASGTPIADVSAAIVEGRMRMDTV